MSEHEGSIYRPGAEGLSQEAQQLLQELRNQGVTNLEELMRQVTTDLSPDDLSGMLLPNPCNERYCFIVRAE